MVVKLSPALCAYSNGKLLHRLCFCSKSSVYYTAAWCSAQHRSLPWIWWRGLSMRLAQPISRDNHHSHYVLAYLLSLVSRPHFSRPLGEK